MNLTNPKELINYFRARGLKPKDYMGQNFLIDQDVLGKIIAIAELKPTDTVLEVGPGLGVLTKELAMRCQKLVAVEKDSSFIPILKTELSNQKNIRIIHDDILKFNIAENMVGDYKLVSNIPYYLTSKLIQNFLESANQPKLMVLMIQKEVGERIVAEAGELSVLGISVQIYAEAEIAAQVSKESFWPTPKVDSVILKITPQDKYPEIKDKKLFFRIIKMAFAGKRKQIKNSLSAYSLELIEKAGIDPKTRPQDLSLEQWVNLYKVIADSLELIGEPEV